MEGDGVGGEPFQMSREGLSKEEHRLGKLLEDADEVAGSESGEGGVEKAAGVVCVLDDAGGGEAGEEARLAVARADFAQRAVQPVFEGGRASIGEVVVPGLAEGVGSELGDEALRDVLVLREGALHGVPEDGEEPEVSPRDAVQLGGAPMIIHVRVGPDEQLAAPLRAVGLGEDAVAAEAAEGALRAPRRRAPDASVEDVDKRQPQGLAPGLLDSQVDHPVLPPKPHRPPRRK
mmetsp:Transcript_38058/g.122190  ORF Transcript_38058/g.122190 Transcript_38058/m.122190 type:complete len:233 (-) Transcript_38058:233-931(-)